MSETTTVTSIDKTVDPNDIKIPKQVYNLRILESEKKKSAKGDPMLVHEIEIFGAKPVNVNGESVDINGLKITKWTVLSEKALKFANIERAAVGLPELANEDDFVPEDYKGLTGYAIVNSEKREQINDQTGEVLVHPKTGQPLVIWNRKLQEWIP